VSKSSSKKRKRERARARCSQKTVKGTKIAKANYRAPREKVILWWRQKFPGILVGLKFMGLSAVIYAVFSLIFHNALQDCLSGLIVMTGNSLIHVLGDNSLRDGTTIFSYRFAVNVAAECTGAETLCIFMAAVLLTPVTRRKRIVGILLGALTLIAINTLRVTCLYLTGAHYPSLFPLLHEKIWPIIMTPMAFLVFLGWLMTTLPAPPERVPCQA
jgi:exosortase/archaeosortase family protein